MQDEDLTQRIITAWEPVQSQLQRVYDALIEWSQSPEVQAWWGYYSQPTKGQVLEELLSVAETTIDRLDALRDDLTVRSDFNDGLIAMLREAVANVRRYQ